MDASNFVFEIEDTSFQMINRKLSARRSNQLKARIFHPMRDSQIYELAIAYASLLLTVG